MSKSVFNKELPKSCAYCVHGRASDYTEEIFCLKKGVTDKFSYCRHYKYDVLKRRPNQTAIADGYKPEDFTL